jgi:hypothetical protein
VNNTLSVFISRFEGLVFAYGMSVSGRQEPVIFPINFERIRLINPAIISDHFAVRFLRKLGYPEQIARSKNKGGVNKNFN